MSAVVKKEHVVPQVLPHVCRYCGACVAVCPELAMELLETQLIIYAERCKKCGNCVVTCPVGALID